MTDQEEKLYAVFSEVRTCFNQLKSLAEQLHSDLGINPSMRAVMETLSRHGQQTVPDIAKRKGVSRQHIQTIMNALVESSLVEVLDNPAHKRSPLHVMTGKGERAYAEICAREKTPLRTIAEQMSPKALADTREVLALLNTQLEHEIGKGNSHEHS